MTLKRTYFDCWIRFFGRDRHLLWYSSDESKDGVWVDSEERIPWFDDSRQLAEAAGKLGFEVEDETPQLLNLDAVSDWVAAPVSESVNCRDFLGAWNFCVDVANSLGSAEAAHFRQTEFHANNLYNKLFCGNNLLVKRGDARRYTPSWQRSELTELANILRLGLAIVESHLDLSGETASAT